jgi:hypothetical protein
MLSNTASTTSPRRAELRIAGRGDQASRFSSSPRRACPCAARPGNCAGSWRAPVERVLGGFQQHHRQSGIDEVMVMPPPMVPAPITPTFSIGRVASSPAHRDVRCGALGLKICRSASRFRRTASAANNSRSRFIPASKGSQGRRDGLDARQWRGVRSRDGLDGVARELQIRLGVRHANARSRTSGTGRFSAMTGARNPAPRSADRPRAHRTGRSLELFGSDGVPDTIMFKAASTPTARGRRCVPPAPGSRPNFTSGNRRPRS